MKKRLISFLLVLTLVISAIPVYAGAATTELAEAGSAENPILISTEQQFRDFLNNANSSSTVYYRLDADITAPEGTVITGTAAKNIELDGQGYTISGYTVKGALFTSLKDSSVRNVKFSGITATSDEADPQLAVLAVETKDSHITNCVFENCTLDANVSEGRVAAAFVAAYSESEITSCVADASCKISVDPSKLTDESLFAGLVADNAGFIISSVSNVSFSSITAAPQEGVSLRIGGIAAENNEEINGCFVKSQAPAAVSDSIAFGQISAEGNAADCYFEEAGKLYDAEGTLISDDKYSLAAKLSTVAQEQSSYSMVAKEDYAKLFTVKDNEIALSADGKDAWVTVSVDKELYSLAGDKAIASAEFKASDPLAKVNFSEEDNTKVSNIITRVGYTGDNGYIRNNIDVTVKFKNSLYAAKAFILNLNFTYMQNCEDVFANDGRSYALNNFIATTSDKGKSNAKVELYPGDATLKISSVTAGDQVGIYEFKGEGTDETPFEISSEYHLDVLKYYISNLSEYKDKNNATKSYSKASYILTEDIILSEGFVPIGSYNAAKNQGFEGSFDGNFHTISNYKHNDDNAYQGFFGLVKGTSENPAVIKNLRILGAEVNSKSGLGGQRGILAGAVEYAEISGCIVSGTVEGTTQLGGLVGNLSNSKVSNCAADVSITSNYNHAWVGGLAGYATFSDFVNNYTVSLIETKYVVSEEYLSLGGIVGNYVNSEFIDCYTDCNVSNEGKYLKTFITAKGISLVKENDIAASNDFLNELIENSDVNDLEAQWRADSEGAFGSMPVPTSRNDAQYYVRNIASSAGTVLSDKLNYKEGETVTVTLYGDITAIEITDSQKNKLDDIPVEYSGDRATFKMPAKSIRILPYSEKVNLVGCGTVEEPFIIYTYEQLMFLSKVTRDYDYYYYYEVKDGNVHKSSRYYRAAHYELGADIDGAYTEDAVDGYSPFYSIESIKGSLDGNGYTISHLKINYEDDEWSAASFISLVGDGAVIKNIRFSELMIKSQGEKGIAEGILAYDIGAGAKILNVSFHNITVNDCDIIGFVGGWANDAIIENCFFNNIKLSNCNEVYRLIAKHNTSDVSLRANNCLFVDDYGDKIAYYPEYKSGNTVEINNVNTYLNIESGAVKIYADYSYASESIDGAYGWGLSSRYDVFDIAYRENEMVSYVFVDDALKANTPVKLIDVDSVPPHKFAGTTVEIDFYRNASLVDFKILSRGEELPYIISDPETDVNGWGKISFVMPEGSVTISNSGAEPVLIIPGHGTKEDPYIISSSQELGMLSRVLHNELLEYKWDNEDYVRYRDACFLVVNDIDMTGVPWNGISGLDSATSFNGTFDGGYYTISNLNSNNGTSDGQRHGLFGEIGKKGIVKNVILAKSSVFASHNYSGAIASVNNGVIRSCMVIDSSVSLGNYIGLGGIAGVNNEGAVIRECAVANTLIQRRHGGTYTCALGGIVHDNYGEIFNCHTYNCSYSNGTTDNGSIAVAVYDNGYVAGCYYYTGSNVKQTKGSSPASIERFNSGEMAYYLNYGDYQEGACWFQNLDNGLTPDLYPVIKYNGKNPVYRVARSDRDYSNYDIGSVYIISNPDELMEFAEFVNTGHNDVDGIVVADIDMTGYEYTPIGYTGLYYGADPADGENKGYCGYFDGQGHVISNLTVKGFGNNDLSYGLFGTVSGTVENIGVENFTYTGNGKDSRVGAVAGQLILGGSLTDCYAKYVTINTQINTNNGVAGGVAGANYAGEINNCYAYGLSIKAGRTGGIVADNFGDGNNSDGTDRPGKVTNSYTDYQNICGRGNSEGGEANITERVFRSGEIVYRLGNSRSSSPWRQGSDELPALKGDVIYQNLCEGEAFYSTKDGDFEHHVIDHENGEVRCENCDHFAPATLVTEENYNSLGLTKDYVGMYAVENASNMYWFSEQDAKRDLTGGIVMLDDITINSAVEPWIPIAVDGNFTFDGRHHTLTLNIDFGTAQKGGYVGVFSSFNYAFARDLIIEGSVKGNSTDGIGGFAGGVYRSTIERVISYADVYNRCETAGKAGGLAGYFGGQHDVSAGLYSQIINCAVYADVTGYEAGGIIGRGWNGKQYYDIKNTAYYGNVKGTYQGAVVGYHGNNQSTYHCTFTDIYYNEADGLGFSGGGNTNYTLSGNVAEKTKAAFASGEVTYLLNNGKTDGTQVWYQNIDISPVDEYPVHTGSAVYKNTMCDGELIEYSNTKDEVVHEYNNYHVCKRCIGLRPGEIAGIWGFSIELGGDIGVKYYMVLDDCVLADENAKMVFGVPYAGDIKYVEVPVSEAEVQGKFHIFTCGVAASEMTANITCQIVIDGNESDVFNYSVKEYADYILANPDSFAGAIDVVKAMLNYGASTQIYFDYRTDDLANDSQYITDEERVIADVDLSEYEYTYAGAQKGVSYYGSSLVFTSGTDIKHYFYFANPADIETLGIYANGQEVTPVKDNDYYYVRISDIPAHKLHCMYETIVGDFVLYYSPFSYGHTVLTTSTNEALKDVVRAMYAYNRKAVEYKNAIQGG